jgi:release factor glutamine methyltransferase
LDAAAHAHFEALCERRRRGEPVAYLIGRWGFHGLSLQVSRAVLVPRPETEGLVDWGLECLRQMQGRDTAPAVIDLGTGSGAIALAVKSRCPHARVTGTDRSAAALRLAQDNARDLQLDVQWKQGDWWSAVPGERYAIALSNPPYINGGDAHLSALAHEPQAALTPGVDGMSALRQIIAGTRAHLLPEAWLLLEHGWDQAEAVRQALLEAGFHRVSTRKDLNGCDRLSGGQT